MKVAIGTLFAASLAHILMHPGTGVLHLHLPGRAADPGRLHARQGRYRGYRLTELFRFKALLKD